MRSIAARRIASRGTCPSRLLGEHVLNNDEKRRGSLRARVGELLHSHGPERSPSDWYDFPPRRVINPLISFLYSTEELVKWKAVEAVGIVVAHLASSDLEAARNIMRRLIWNLNDESGGIGWGSAEAMGEIMAMHETMAEEYYRVLLSYVCEGCNLLGNDLLECGALWGLGRLAQVRPQLLRCAAPAFFRYLAFPDPLHRGLAAWTLGFLGTVPPRALLDTFSEDSRQIKVYEKGELRTYRICDLVKPLIERSSQSC